MVRYLTILMVAASLMFAGWGAFESRLVRAADHGGNLVLDRERADLLELVPDAAVTHRVVADGSWSDAATWHDGRRPSADANVLVPSGRTVSVDRVESIVLRTIRVDGKLRFAPDRDTKLVVDTLVVAEGGELEIGTQMQPIAADKTARIVIADRGPIDTKWDPKQLGRGLISHGKVTMHGAPTTPFVRLAQAPGRGDVKLVPVKPAKGASLNWKLGDRLIVPAVRYRERDEQRTIQSIADGAISIEPLEQDHDVQAADLSVPVANVSRNVIIESQSVDDPTRAGHVMFMHTPEVNIAYVAFHHLGRTDKRKPINDPVIVERRIAENTGTNPRGRYAVHFHRTGSTEENRPASVKGSVVLHSPGWGFVNHSSFVEIEDNVAYDVAGSAFVTEAGDEIGTFHRNFAIRSIGSGRDISERTEIQDFGHEGDGFWFQGAGVSVENNIASGQRETGFIFFTRGLLQSGLGRMRFASSNLEDRSWTKGRLDVEVGQVPIRSFRGNEAFACRTGFIPRHHLTGQKEPGPRCPEVSMLTDSTVWNSEIGVHVRYSSNVVLQNLRLVGNRGEKERARVAVSGQIEEVNNIVCRNLKIEGWRTGIDIRESGSWSIDGGTFDNDIDIFIPTTIERGRKVKITGDIRFAAEPKQADHYDIYLGAEFGTLLQGRYAGRNPNFLFTPDIIEYRGMQLYYREQAADHVPLRHDLSPSDRKHLGTAQGSLPEELIGKTNRELWDRYGLAVAGAVAPADAKKEPRIHGLIGSNASYAKPEIVNHTFKSERLHDFKLACFAPDKKLVAESAPTDLRTGWNLLTLTIADQPRSFIVYGGAIPKDRKGYGND